MSNLVCKVPDGTNELRSGNEITDPNDIDNQSPNNFPVTYHKTLSDAESNLEPIIGSYTNEIDENGNLYDPQTIFYRIQKLNNDGDLIKLFWISMLSNKNS